MSSTPQNEPAESAGSAESAESAGPANSPEAAEALTPTSGEDAWRFLGRTALLGIGVVVGLGLLALSLLALLGGGGDALRTAWRVTTIFGVGQLGGLVAAAIAGAAHVRVLRGAEPQPLAAPVRSRVRRVSLVTIVLTLGAALVWVFLEPAAWITTLALGLVALQGGIVLWLMTGTMPGGRANGTSTRRAGRR